MNTMTTNEAAKMAAEIHAKGGMTYAKVGKILAKNGYYSWRTGKPVTGGGVHAMIRKFQAGEEMVDRTPRKHAAIFARRARNTAAKREERARKKTNPPMSLGIEPRANNSYPESLDYLAEENMARQVLQIAIKKAVKAIFGVDCQILLPLNRTFRP